MSIYWLCLIPLVLWLSAAILQNDRLNSRITANLFLAAAVLCALAGLALRRYGVFPEKRGFFTVVFAVPLTFIGCFELFRLIYKLLRDEDPCINVRTMRRIGDRPVDGFFTTYPPGKVISGADVIFGISQMMIPLAITMVGLIWSLASNW